MGWIISLILLVIYLGTDMVQWQLLIASVAFAILGVIEEKKSK